MPDITRDMDAGALHTLWASMETYYADTWEKMHAAQSLYDHSFPWLKNQVPEGIDIHEPSTASSIIDHFRDNIRVRNIVPVRADWGISEQARRQKALLLRLDKHIIEHFRAESPIDPYVQTIFDMALRGASCWQLGFDKRLWPNGDGDAFEFERGLKFPIWARPVDPLAVAPAPGCEFPVPWLLVKYPLTASEAAQRWPHWVNPNNRKPTTIITVVELWSSDDYDDEGGLVPGVHKVTVDIGGKHQGNLVVDSTNPFGIVPFVFEYSGMGRVNYDNDPQHLAVNLLEKATSELIAEARLRTAADAAWQWTAYPRLMSTEDPRTVKMRWDMSSGGILQVTGLGPDQRPQWLEQPQIDSAMWQFLPMIQRSIERATYSAVLEGQRTPGVDFGYLQALLIGQASLRKDNIIGMASRLFARAVGVAERMLVHLDIGPIVLGPGTVGEEARRVRPSQIGDRYDLNVVLEASDPAERDRRMISWLSLLRAGAISKRTYLREGMMKDDPDEELAAIYEEAAVEQILMSGLLTQSILEELQTEGETENLTGMTNELLSRVQQGAAQAPRVPTQPGPGAPTGQPPTQPEGPLTQSPMGIMRQMQSNERRATSLRRTS